MKAAFIEQMWDIIISDYSMPHFSGLAALAILKETEIDLPFIILSGAIGEETTVEAMKAGAHDYVMKGNLTRLIPAIERELREVGVRQEQKRTDLAIVKANAQLETTIIELKVSQAQLLQSAKLAAVGELVSGVAHELNNPLAAISMYGELLQDAFG